MQRLSPKDLKTIFQSVRAPEMGAAGTEVLGVMKAVLPELGAAMADLRAEGIDTALLFTGCDLFQGDPSGIKLRGELRIADATYPVGLALQHDKADFHVAMRQDAAADPAFDVFTTEPVNLLDAPEQHEELQDGVSGTGILQTQIIAQYAVITMLHEADTGGLFGLAQDATVKKPATGLQAPRFNLTPKPR